MPPCPRIAAASSPLVAPDHRLTPVHARYTAVVDLDVEFLCRSLKLDPETVSDRGKSDDLDLADREVKALSQPSSCKFGLRLRPNNICLTTMQDATGDHVPQDRRASEPAQHGRNFNDELSSGSWCPQLISVMLC